MIRLLISFVGLRTLAVVLAACCFAPPVRAQTPPPLPRVAIVPGSEDPQLGTLADLLIVSMARASQRYELVERAELNRIAQEAEVQAMSAAERPRALARLAKADGLILLTVDRSEPGHRSISARLYFGAVFVRKDMTKSEIHAGMGSKMPPQDKVSLVCFQPGRKEPLEIPLSFQPETMRKFLTQKPTDTPLPFPPEFSSRKLETTSAGLFFNFNVYGEGGGGAVGDSPGLLYVPWKDVNDWLTRHGHAPIGTRKTK